MQVFSALWMNWIFKCYLDKVWASSVLPILSWRPHCDNHLLPATLATKHIKSGVFWDIMLCSLKICAVFHRNTLPPHIQYQKVTHGTPIKPDFQLREFKWEELYSGCTEPGVKISKSLQVLCLTQYHSDHTGSITSCNLLKYYLVIPVSILFNVKWTSQFKG